MLYVYNTVVILNSTSPDNIIWAWDVSNAAMQVQYVL